MYMSHVRVKGRREGENPSFLISKCLRILRRISQQLASFSFFSFFFCFLFFVFVFFVLL